MDTQLDTPVTKKQQSAPDSNSHSAKTGQNQQKLGRNPFGAKASAGAEAVKKPRAPRKAKAAQAAQADSEMDLALPKWVVRAADWSLVPFKAVILVVGVYRELKRAQGPSADRATVDPASLH